MKYKKIIIEEAEFELLKNMLSKTQNNGDGIYNLSIKRLQKELETAKITVSELVPDDVIRINSTVTIQISGNMIRTFKLVVPEKSNLTQDKLSILSPMGLALVGYAANDEIKWQFPSGIATIKILKVLQIKTTQKL